MKRNDMWQSPLYTDLLQENERIDLEKTFGPFKSEHSVIEMNPAYFEEWQELIQQKRNRRGEVALAIENPDGDILLHTKSFYPGGIYRIPTGGLHYGEKVSDCIDREVYEETGFTNYTKKLLATIFYEFKCQGKRQGFLSFLVKINTMDLTPVPTDDSEDISDFRWVKMDELNHVIAQLQKLDKKWADWGRMRAVPHEVLLEL